MSKTWPTRISGKVEFADGESVQFSINPDLGWQQWQETAPGVAGRNVDLLEALAGAAGEFIRDEEADDTEEDEGDAATLKCLGCGKANLDTHACPNSSTHPDVQEGQWKVHAYCLDCCGCPEHTEDGK